MWNFMHVTCMVQMWLKISCMFHAWYTCHTHVLCIGDANFLKHAWFMHVSYLHAWNSHGSCMAVAFHAWYIHESSFHVWNVLKHACFRCSISSRDVPFVSSLLQPRNSCHIGLAALTPNGHGFNEKWVWSKIFSKVRTITWPSNAPQPSTSSCVFFVKKELSHQSSWQANKAISPKRIVFSEVHIIHTFKSL